MASVFSRIISGDAPARFVWKDDDVVAFLTIAPVAQGHTLIVPKSEVDHWTDADPDLFEAVMVVAQKIGKAVQSAFAAPRVFLFIAGMEVEHLHVHVYPAHHNVSIDVRGVDRRPAPSSLDRAQERIRSALTASGYGHNVPRR